MDWIDAFIRYTAPLPSPEIFRRWAAISGVAGALERRVFTRLAGRPIYPNLYALMVAPPGVGKCLSPETPVLTFDGNAIPAQDVYIGQYLLGPDGSPRLVTERADGYGEMFEIIPTKGSPWRCNGAHILSLKKSRNPGKGQIKFVTVSDWIQWTAWQKSEWKLWRTGEINFAYRDEPTLDPYFVGIMLGDGDSLIFNRISVTTKDKEILDCFYDIAWNHNMIVVPQACGIRFLMKGVKWPNNIILDKMRAYGLTATCGEKFVPDIYKYGNVQTRKEILAGLLDTDGSFVPHANCYDFISKSKKLADDVTMLARSLGLAAYCKPTIKTAGDFSGTYWRVSISGNCSVIPCRIPRKKARARAQIKDTNVTGFTVKSIGPGSWAGFAVDGDHQYVLGDFTVTHNTVAVDEIRDLWRAVDRPGFGKLHIAPNSVTKAALLDCLENAKRMIMVGEAELRKPLEYNSLNVAASEFGVLVPAHDNEFLNTLNDIYDNPPAFVESRRTSKSTSINQPQLNIIAGTQPGYLANLLPEEAWSMGFMSRVLMIYAASGPQIDLFGSPGLNRDTRQTLIGGLSRFTSLYGEVGFEEDARTELVRWYKSGLGPVPEHSKLQHYNSRRLLQVIKLTIISTASAGNGLVVTLKALNRARDWLLEAETLMPDVFKEMTQRSDSQVIQELHYFMWRIYAKDKRPLHESRMIHFLQTRVPSEKILRVVEIAARSNIIKIVGEKQWVPVPSNEHGME